MDNDLPMARTHLAPSRYVPAAGRVRATGIEYAVPEWA